LHLGSIAGIPIRVHVTLVLLIALLAFSYWLGGLGVRGALASALLMTSVFVIVLIHELGHALVARRFGVRTHDILLLPIGGIASLERVPDRPLHELVIALVGPLINVVLAGALWIGIAAAGWDLTPTDAGSLGEAFTVRLFWINVLLAAFNLVPAFPLDGGRALRALLSMRLRRATATAIAANLGRGLAVVLAVLGLLFNPWLVLIAVVIWIGAGHELSMIQLRSSLTGVPVTAAMLRRIDVVQADDPLERVGALMIEHGTSAAPIIDDHGDTIGVVTRSDVATGIVTAGPRAAVAAAPHHQALTVQPSTPLDEVLDQLSMTPDAIAVVVENDAPIGLVTPEQLASYAVLHGGPETTSTA
jgi:Zn-dependent protease/CBS domain-containing protein